MSDETLEPPWQRVVPPPEALVLARAVVLRAMGFVYGVAFLTFALQFRGLLGAHGLTPIADFTSAERSGLTGWDGFFQLPSLFWWSASDTTLAVVGWSGVGLSALVLLGVANAPIMLVLWALYQSIVNVGQAWYSFGWEMQLLETGFIGIFLAPALDPYSRRAPTPIPFMLLAWLLVRLMLGAGLIKLRGDDCWRDFTCLFYHYETQPVPHPLSWLLHKEPGWLHRLGVAFNHFTELVVPFFVFGPRTLRFVAAAIMTLFQVTLILSGNLAFLNWLTLVACFACFDDRVWGRVWRARREVLPPSRAAWIVSGAVAVLFAVLSLEPIANLLSSEQHMNTSFNRLHLVNTYGAFGSIGKERREIVIEGSNDGANWLSYEFRCKPGDPARAPCLITPYHRRLDWLMWFAAMGGPNRYPWFSLLLYKLLHGERAVIDLLANDPFPDRPPRYLRALLYRYRFSGFGEAGWWVRDEPKIYVRPITLEAFEE